MNALAHASAAQTGPQLDNRRVAAALVDMLVLALVTGVLSTVMGGFSPAVGALGLAWTLYYFFAFESGGGQTLGKRLLRIRVVRADGAPAGMREIAVRTVLRLVDGIGLYLVGLIVMMASGERRQRLGDLAAGTVVTAADATAAAPPSTEAPDVVADHDLDPDPTVPLEPAQDAPLDVGGTQPSEQAPAEPAAEEPPTVAPFWQQQEDRAEAPARDPEPFDSPAPAYQEEPAPASDAADAYWSQPQEPDVQEPEVEEDPRLDEEPEPEPEEPEAPADWDAPDDAPRIEIVSTGVPGPAEPPLEEHTPAGLAEPPSGLDDGPTPGLPGEPAGRPEPQPEPAPADEPEPAAESRSATSGIEIVSSPIDMVMAEEDEGAEPDERRSEPGAGPDGENTRL